MDVEIMMGGWRPGTDKGEYSNSVSSERKMMEAFSLVLSVMVSSMRGSFLMLEGAFFRNNKAVLLVHNTQSGRGEWCCQQVGVASDVRVVCVNCGLDDVLFGLSGCSPEYFSQ